MTIICVLILFLPYWRLFSWFPLLFLPIFILAFFCSLPTSIFVSLTARFIIELYPRTSQRFDQAGNKSSVASKLLLHTHTREHKWSKRKKGEALERRKEEREKRRTRADKQRRQMVEGAVEKPRRERVGSYSRLATSKSHSEVPRAFEIFLLNELQAVADSSLAG